MAEGFDWDAETLPTKAPSFDWDAESKPEEVDGITAAVRGFNQGATLGWADELIAKGEAAFPRLRSWDALLGREEAKPVTYEQARDEQRALERTTREQRPGVYIPAEVGGTLATNIAAGPAARGYAGAVATGALSGAGASEAETATGVAGDAALGAGLGAAGQYVGNQLGRGAGAVRDWVLRKAAQGKEAARSTAQALAERDVGKVVNSLRGEAGGAASRAANVISNIDEIALPADVPRRTVAEARGALQQQIQAIDDAIASARAKAVASGIDPANPGVGRRGEFLSPGSKQDAAQKAADKLRTYEAAKREIEGRLQGLASRAADEVLPDDAGALRQAQAALRDDPRFLDLKQNILKNSLDDFPAAEADAAAKREAFQQALVSKPADVARRADMLLSGDAALEQVKQRAQRYAAPLAGSVLGGGAGAVVGLAVGNDPIDAATFALAGAGVRPAVQAVRRMAGHPAVQNAAWSSLESLATTAPQSFGKFARMVTQAASQGPEALRVFDKVMRDTNPEWRTLREQQESEAARAR